MKFLCVKCDSAMRLSRTDFHEDIGSLAAVYSCEKCGQQTAMLTNPGETQLVKSLGVTIGPKGESTGDVSKCPFSSLFSGEEKVQPSSTSISWTDNARARLNQVPEFVRPMAVMSIERFAKEQGISVVSEDVLDKARTMFGLT